MAASQNSSPLIVPPTKKPGKSRRVWTRPEEMALLDALKDLVANGWRADNAFRPGYLDQLETAIAKKFPHSRLTGHRHINSKMTVWKKTYSHLNGICNTSGFGFDPTTNMIEVEADDVWDAYVRVHREVDTYRNKSYPYYEDWKIIFGQDRANGKGALNITDAILDLEHPHSVEDEVYDIHVVNGAKGKQVKDTTKVARSTNPNGGDINFDQNDVEEATSARNDNYRGDPNHQDQVGKIDTRKRKSRDAISMQEHLISVLGSLFDKSNETLSEMTNKIIAFNAPPPPPPSPPNKTKMVFDIVNTMSNLPLELRILVAHKIINNQQNVDLFLTMDNFCQSKFVDMLVTGSISEGGGGPAQ